MITQSTPYSFPMANGFHKRNPYPGVSLFCVGSNSLQCRDTVPPNARGYPLPVLYGTTLPPSGFVAHDSDECPVPRVSTFETLEEFWAQDFLQTFMNCLKDSDFKTSSARDFGVDNAYIFNNSTRQGVNMQTYSNQYPYQCCLYPSFYQAAVRGQEQLTLYFNPLFSSQFDYNCHIEDDCLGYGSINITSNSSNTDLKKATPHSSHWYLMNSIALLETESTAVQFWKNHQVGNTHTQDEVSLQLFGLSYGALLGDDQNAVDNAIGSHYTAAKVYNSDPLLRISQYRLQDVSEIFCPTRPKFSILAPSSIDRYRSGLKQPYHNYITLRYPTESVDSQQNNQQLPIEAFNRNFFDSPLPNGRWVDDPDFKLPTKLACCVRDMPSLEKLYFKTMSKFFTPQITAGVVGPPFTTTNFSTSRFYSITGACEPFLCPTSPICHNLLLNYCSNSLESHSSQYCRRWHSWASSNYGPKSTNVLNNYVSWTSQDLPWGSHNVGVDMSNRSLLSACSTSQGLGATTTSLYKDLCQGLFSTTYQTNFPRLHTFEWGDAIQYSVENVFPYYLDRLDSLISVQLFYARYENVIDSTKPSLPVQRYIWSFNSSENSKFISRLDKPYAYMPKWTSVTLASLFLTDQYNGTISELDFNSFYPLIQNGFNLALKDINGNFSLFPDSPLPTFTQTLTTRIGTSGEDPAGDRVVTVTPFYPNHKTDLVSWVNNTFTVSHETTFTQPSRRGVLDINRLEDPNFLYSSQTALQLFGGPGNRQNTPFQLPSNGTTISWNRVTWSTANRSNFVNNNNLIVSTATTLYNSMFDLYDAGGGNYSWTMCGTTPCYNKDDSIIIKSFVPQVFEKGPSFGLVSYIPMTDAPSYTAYGALVPEGVFGKTAPYQRSVQTTNDIGVVYPELKIKFTEKLAYFLNLPSTETIITMSGISVEPNTVDKRTYTVPINPTGQEPFRVRNIAKFYITNTSNIAFQSLSVLNPFSSSFTVTLSTLSLLPGERSLCEVRMINIDTITQPLVSLTLFPILFFDSLSWQPSLSSQDYPVLGGFYACQTFDDALIRNDFAGNRFSEYRVDPNLVNSTDPSYLSNQSIYPRGAAPVTARNLTIVPLV